MKYFRLLIGSLSIVCLLWCCKGEQGDPGPIGPMGDQGTKGDNGSNGEDGDDGDNEVVRKAGFFEGILSGTRRDGTALQETFRFEYAEPGNIEAFSQRGNDRFLKLSRYGNAIGSVWMTMDLKLDNNSLVGGDVSPVWFFLERELSSTKLFQLMVSPYMMDSPGFAEEINDDDNAIFKFSKGYNPNNPNIGRGIYYEHITYRGVEIYRLLSGYLNKPNGRNIEVYYRRDNGSLMVVRDDGDDILTGPVFDFFNTLKLREDPNLRIPVFYRDALPSGQNLSAIIPDTPADELIISNYAMNAVTGILSFDYTLKVSAYRSKQYGDNTTRHALTITGKFNSGDKVYESIEGRIGK